MSKLVVPKTTATVLQNAVPGAGQIIYNKSTRQMVYGDGVTEGGIPLNAADVHSVVVGEGQGDAFAGSRGVALEATVQQLVEVVEVTRFEVYPTSTDIAAGTVDAVTGLQYNMEVPANRIHRVEIKTTVPVDAVHNADVIIDWGDGTAEPLSSYYSANDQWEAKQRVYYTMRHTYSAEGRYIVTIRGTQYYGIQHSSAENCLCRAFDTDLPVASCLNNYSNFCNGAMKLLKVHVPDGYRWNSKLANCYGVFYGCRNMLIATGMDESFTHVLTVKEMFNDCRSMHTCDMVLPASVEEYDGYQRVFHNCYYLNADIKTLFPVHGFSNRVMYMKDCFSNCSRLTGTVPADMLWEDTGKVWLEPASIVNSVSAALKAQIPVAWGGTNKDIVVPRAANQEYTAFEVYATDAAIPAGTVDDVTGLAYSVAVPAGMTHKMSIRTDIGPADAAKADVVIDWGDGTASKLTDAYRTLDMDWQSDGEMRYLMEHTYTAPGRYIVTIHGKDYWGIENFNQSQFEEQQAYNLISRAFDADLPIASNVDNISLFCGFSKKLLKVHIPTGLDLYANVHNAYGVFNNCVNLVSATGLKTKFRYARDVSRMFSNCNNMTTCDFELPNTVIKQTGYDAVFKYCYKLTADISKLIPGNGFANRYVRLCETFSQCPKLTGTVRADMLWEDTSKVWSLRPNTEYQLPFEGCSDAVRSQVPVSWGGTMEWTPPPKNAVVDALPDNPDENTIYFITGE